MARETRTRIDIFIPVKTQEPAKRIDSTYRAIVYATIEWITVEMGFIHGGVTLSSVVSPVFTGFYRDPENPNILVRDDIVWITVDVQAPAESRELEIYLSDLKRKIQSDLYTEKEIWITYAEVYRVI